MSTLASLVLSLLLTAGPSFVPPKVAPMSDALKCDTGVLIAVDAAVNQIRVNTPAGLVFYKVSADSQVIGKDGKGAGSVGSIAPGTRVRVYYVVDDGAKVQEIDLE
jgi:hypothetical protein